jgi:hypothetical protein
MTTTPFLFISSADWDLPSGAAGTDRVEALLGLPYAELEHRCRLAVYDFVVGCFDDQQGATRHYYEAPAHRYDELDSGNFLIALNYLTMYDRYEDDAMLDRAERSYLWAYKNRVVNHPMMSWQGGVRDDFAPHELYVKYTADALTAVLALRARRPREEYDLHIAQYHNFLKQARKAGFAFTYDSTTHEWRDRGFVWRGFGGPVLAYLQAHDTLGDDIYRTEAVAWAEYGLTQIEDDGAMYLLDGEFWNSDLAALELRAFVHVFEVTGDDRFRDAACRYANWLVAHQRADGAWPIGIDRDGEVCAPNVGPGDMSNIAISLVRLHFVTHDAAYLDAAVGAVRYAIGQQLCGPEQRYYEDDAARWGFWSWDPPYDYTLSGDQVVHHVRGIMAIADVVGSVDVA